MAITALQSAASGLSALNTSLDVLANNLANVNTAGFKSSRANFQDLLYVEKAQPGNQNANGDESPTGLYVGLGVKVSGTQVDFTQGVPVRTDTPTDLAISGLGFFRVKVQDSVGNGGFAYTRNGQFTLNSDGQLVMVNDQGRRLADDITVPQGARDSFKVNANGKVTVDVPGQSQPQDIGEIQTVVFINPTGLKQVGENLFVETGASGPPVLGTPGTENFGEILQGVYEASNVDPTRELIELIRTQRAFEMNSQTIRAADQNLQTIAQLRR